MLSPESELILTIETNEPDVTTYTNQSVGQSIQSHWGRAALVTAIAENTTIPFLKFFTNSGDNTVDKCPSAHEMARAERRLAHCRFIEQICSQGFDIQYSDV